MAPFRETTNVTKHAAVRWTLAPQWRDDKPGVAARIFKSLAHAHVNVDMIVQNVSASGHTDLTFTVGKDDVVKTLESWERIGSTRSEEKLKEILGQDRATRLLKKIKSTE